MKEAKSREIPANQKEIESRDNWATPPEVFESICEYWQIYPTIDVMADADNTKCKYYLTEEDDALRTDWVALANELGVSPVFWMNPPFSQPTLSCAILKALEMAKKGGTTLYVLPAWTDRAWYHDYIKATPHEFTRGRIKFLPPKGVKPTTPRFSGHMHGHIPNLMEPALKPVEYSPYTEPEGAR